MNQWIHRKKKKKKKEEDELWGVLYIYIIEKLTYSFYFANLFFIFIFMFAKPLNYIRYNFQ